MLQSKEKLDKESKQFKEANAAVVALVKRAIEPIGVKKRAHGGAVERIFAAFPGGTIAWYRSMPWNFPFPGGDQANKHLEYVDISVPHTKMHIGINGAFHCPRRDDGMSYNLSPEPSNAEYVKAIVSLAFEMLAKDLADRSMAGVAQELRAKSISFGKFNKIVDIAKEVLGK